MENYYRVDLKCRVWDEPYKKSHIAGRHVFVKAENETEAIKKIERKFSNEPYTKIISVNLIDYIPSIGIIK